MRATLPAFAAATFAMSILGCESMLVVPADEVISAETFRLLSRADIHAVERLAVAIAPEKPITAIRATSPDQVSVECGDPYRREAMVTYFTAHRKSGRWVVDKPSIASAQPVILRD